MNLAELLHFCLTAERTGKIAFKIGDKEGQLFISAGEVLAAAYSGQTGEEAFFSMIAERGGQADFSESSVETERNIHQATHYLLMEAARRSDELSRQDATQVLSNSPGSSTFCLIFITMDGARFALQGDTVVIGRDAQCDITVPDVSVSSQHCRILWNGRDHLIDDLNSFNGTYVNGVALERAVPLRVGDHIQVGLCHFQYQLLSASDAVTDPKVAVPFTFGSETQRIQLPPKTPPMPMN